MAMKFAVMIFMIFFQGVFGLYGTTSSIKELSEDSFKEKVLDAPTYWIIKFYAPWCGHCKAMVEDWVKVSNSLMGIIKVGTLDADKYKSLAGSMGVQGFPTIMLFGLDKKKPVTYDGARTAEGITRFVMKQLRIIALSKLGLKDSDESAESESGDDSSSGQVVTLTEQNFESTIRGSKDHWMVEFFAPWCGHCKNLAPHWAEAARTLKGTAMKFAAVDATVHQSLASKFGLTGYPTIKYFPPGSLNLAADAQNYDGGRTASDIISWCRPKLVKEEPLPKLMQMTQQSVFEKECTSKSLCVISFLPDLLDSSVEERQRMLSYLEKSMVEFPRSWRWLWSVGGAQIKFEDSLNVGGYGYPAMAAIHTGKGLVSLLKGRFDQKGIVEFLRDLQYGRTHVGKMGAIPAIKTVDAWDGKQSGTPHATGSSQESKHSKQEL